jgi:hypothetical protein
MRLRHNIDRAADCHHQDQLLVHLCSHTHAHAHAYVHAHAHVHAHPHIDAHEPALTVTFAYLTRACDCATTLTELPTVTIKTSCWCTCVCERVDDVLGSRISTSINAIYRFAAALQSESSGIEALQVVRRATLESLQGARMGARCPFTCSSFVLLAGHTSAHEDKAACTRTRRRRRHLSH